MAVRTRWRRAAQVVAVLVLAVVTVVVAGRVALREPERPPAKDTRPVAAFIGDAATAGEAASSPEVRWSRLLSDQQGWREANFALSGTGYATTAPSEECEEKTCPPYAEVVDRAAALDPAVVVVAGGQSDWFAYENDPRAVADKVGSLLDTLQMRLPRSTLLVVGPALAPGAEHQTTVRRIDDVVRSAAADRGLGYVSLLAPENVLAGRDVVSQDRYLPNDAGHEAIAARVASALAP